MQYWVRQNYIEACPHDGNSNFGVIRGNKILFDIHYSLVSTVNLCSLVDYKFRRTKPKIFSLCDVILSSTSTSVTLSLSAYRSRYRNRSRTISRTKCRIPGSCRSTCHCGLSALSCGYAQRNETEAVRVS